MIAALLLFPFIYAALCIAVLGAILKVASFRRGRSARRVYR